MIEEITILILEDVSTDFELISREIKRHIPSPLLYVSSNKDEFLKALVEVNPDIILSDYYLPTINGMDALKLSQQHDPFRPFIIVTGSINEETAVECIKGGASDYILKDWLNRLVPSIEMAYRKSQLERDAEQKNLYKAKMVDLLRCERDLGIALGLINDLPDALELIIQSLCNLDNFDYGGIYLLDPQTKILQLAVHHGVDKELLEKISVFKPDAAQNEFYRRGKPSFIFYDDVQIGHYTSVVKDVKGIARLPLNKENEPIGLIVLGSRQKKVFEDELKDILITLASLAGNLISRLQTETTLRKMFKAVEQSPAVILITDKDGHIEYTNPKFTEVTGYTKAEARGKTPRILKSGYMNPNDYKVLWDTILSGKEWKGEILNKKKDNSLFWEMANISPVFDQDGNITNFIAIKEDITRDKAIQEELVQAKTKAEESDCIKSSLLTNLSHEFRTPLTAILGFTNFLRMEVHDNHHLELLNNILVSGDNLLNTLDSILTLAQLEGEVKLNLQSADLGLLLKELCTTFEGKISTKGLKFEFQEINDQCLIETDTSLLTVAFKKLLENAIKFTDEGVVSVLLETVDRGKDRYHRIRFKDTGIGIASKDYALVFEPFRQASEVLGRHFEGSGLGLPIAKKVIGLLKGELEIESMLYKGSTFTVYLPCARKQKGISASPVIAEGKPSIPALVELLSLFDRKPNVLLVEDNEMNGVLVISMLSKICRVVHAWNGKAAIERSSEEIFDLVLMDINLGAGLNGMEVTREIKKNEAYKNIPFSAVTGYTLKEEREKILNAGLNFYLGKPFKKDELLSTIQAMLFDLLKSMGKL